MSRSSPDIETAEDWERRIKEKVWASECLTAGEWVYLVGVFHAANEAETRATQPAAPAGGDSGEAVAWLPISTAPATVQEFAKHCEISDDRNGFIEFGGTIADGRPFVLCLVDAFSKVYDRWFVLPSVERATPSAMAQSDDGSRSSAATATLADKIERLAKDATAAPWKSRGMGGHSILLAKAQPAHNRRVPVAYGYKLEAEDGYSIGLPFSYEEGGKQIHRGDFVEFSHRDAELIATLVNACPDIIAALRDAAQREQDPDAMNDQRMLDDMTLADNVRRGVIEECARVADLSAANAAIWATQQMAIGIAAHIRALTLPSTHCPACDGRRLVGGFVSADSGYQDDPCPDCSASSPQSESGK